MTRPAWTGLTPADRSIIDNGVDMEIWTNPGPIDDFPNIGPDGTISFQFPPRLTTDGKASIWDEKPQQTYEPLALFMGSEARKISLETQYVVTGKAGNNWDIADVAETLRLYKSYFYMTMNSVGVESMPLVRLKIYEYANDPKIFWRAKSVNITPDGSLITDGSSTISLIHRVTMNLEMITQVLDNGVALHDISVLPATPKKEWY
jgi:hypothetical protein